MFFFFTTILFAVFSLFGEESSTTRIFYIRHGEVTGNDPHSPTYMYTGSGTDDSLTEKGREQAMLCAKKISKLQTDGRIGTASAIYASDLKRAVETAQYLADELGLDVQLSHNLREISWGSADGQLVQEMTEQWGEMEKQIKLRYPERKIRWDHLPVFEGAETYNALLKRSQEELESIGEMHRGELVIVVGHGRVLKTLLADALDREERIPYLSNCGIAEFTYSLDSGLRFVKVYEEK